MLLTCSPYFVHVTCNFFLFIGHEHHSYEADTSYWRSIEAYCKHWNAVHWCYGRIIEEIDVYQARHPPLISGPCFQRSESVRFCELLTIERSRVEDIVFWLTSVTCALNRVTPTSRHLHVEVSRLRLILVNHPFCIVDVWWHRCEQVPEDFFHSLTAG